MARDESESQKQSAEQLRPGDQGAPGTPGTGEDLCPECNGSGKLDSRPCPTCGGTGKVIQGIGGG